jgi:hypothetical protein
MSSKTIIAVLTAFLAAVAAAPAGAQAATLCPPGVTNAPYCVVGNASGLILERRLTRMSGNRSSGDRSIEMTVRCTLSSSCTGRLYLESSSGGKIYGTARYAIKGGTRAALRIRFTAAARRTLERIGRLTVTVAVVSNGVRSVIGRLSVKGLEKHGKHA